MTRFAIDVLPPAEAEIREAFLWYFERSPLAAHAFRSEALEAIDALGEHADMWPPDEDEVRHYHLRHFPYTVHYVLEREVATVLAVGPDFDSSWSHLGRWSPQVVDLCSWRHAQTAKFIDTWSGRNGLTALVCGS